MRRKSVHTMPDSSHGARASTPAFTYTLRRIPPRDEIVFKSVVRVLQGKTRHTWQHTDAADADLVVMGMQVPGQQAGFLHVAGHALIQVSTMAGAVGADFHGLTLPLRIADVIDYLDGAGDEIASHMARPAGPGVVQAAAAVHVPFNQRVSLTRWPELALLQGDVRYLKLATVLTGLPVSITELAARTQFPLQLCQTFVDALKASGLVRVTDDQREVPVGQRVSPSGAQPQKPHPGGHHGLIARIRSRLEMFVRTSAAK
ncbi:hypothetical protein D9M73_52630 [compost metagenome]